MDHSCGTKLAWKKDWVECCVMRIAASLCDGLCVGKHVDYGRMLSATEIKILPTKNINMANEKIIAEVSYKLSNYSYNKEIEDYLRSQGIAEADFTSIIDAAQSKLTEEKAAYFSKRNKRFFYIWLSLALITLVLFLFILPYKNIGGSETVLAILGTGVFCFFCFLALAYNKTWKPDFVQKHEKPNIQYSFLVVFLIPAVIIYFIFSWRFTAGQEQVLKQTQEKATGTIVSGKTTQVKRLRGGGFEFSEVTVEFQTKDGIAVVATEDVSSYELKNFYKGQ